MSKGGVQTVKKEKQFETWLQTGKGLTKETAESRLSNCRRLDALYDLDKQYALNQCSELIRSLSYSKKAEFLSAPALHKVPMDGNLYDGTATLRRAVKLYVEFMSIQKFSAGNSEQNPLES